MLRVAIVDDVTNIVDNIVVANSLDDCGQPGTFAIDVTDGPPCGPGWVYDPATGLFTDPSV